MPRSTNKTRSKQGPPLQFRPGVELQRLVEQFAAMHGLEPNEACKALAALAVTGMDCRYFNLVKQLADAMGGFNAFVRACIHVENMVGGATRADSRYRIEPERSLFILQIISEFLSARGLAVQTEGLWFVPQAEEPQMRVRTGATTKVRRKVRAGVLKDE